MSTSEEPQARISRSDEQTPDVEGHRFSNAMYTEPDMHKRAGVNSDEDSDDTPDFEGHRMTDMITEPGAHRRAGLNDEDSDDTPDFEGHIRR